MNSVKNKKKGARGVMKKKSSKAVRYNKWGYIFLIPFILVYVVFQLIPLFNTIYNSFFENYLSGLTQIGPNHIRQFIRAISPLALPVFARNLYGSEMIPICIKIELIGPPSENSVKNNMENADAMIRFGR